jgi:hypothetical protein
MTNEESAEAKLVLAMPCKEEFFLRSEKNKRKYEECFKSNYTGK